MPSSVLVRVVFGLLVVATAAAFLVAQRLKRSTPIVENVYYNRYFSPTCRCPKDRVKIYFTLRDAGRVTATMVNSAGDDVRTLVDARFLHRGRHHYRWNGRTDSGVVAPDGRYRLRVTLRDQARAVTSGRILILDTTPPHPRILAVTPSVIVPGAPGAIGRARVRYHGRSNPHPLVRIYRTDVPKPKEVAFFQAPRFRKTVMWDGMVGGKPAPDGIYAITITTYDRSGNAGSWPRLLPPDRSETKPNTGVSVRYLTVSGSLDPVTAGSVARFHIGPLPRRLRWSLGPVRPAAAVAHGTGGGRGLSVRVPSSAASGVYLLRVQAGGHHATQPVVVQGRQRGKVLVVVPAIAWQGGNRVDDDGDGFANTLAAGDSVQSERAFAHGLPPAGLVDRVDPLLRFLDRTKVPYEITSDLALAEGRGPQLAGRRGVMFVGDETWLTDKLDLALRSYVERGGRVASFGTDSFRRRVGLAGSQLVNPTPPERVNVFGEQTASVRIQQAPMVVNQPDTLGLFAGVSGGLLGSFDQFEQSQRLVGGTQILSSAGRDPKHPAFVAYRLGKGIVVRVGSSQWASSLAGDVELTDVTRRVWSLLSQ
ncbi:MAG TPA: N,N-dimethylformamidase beta subunit family domain-containing protein [Thermoleophilaceae bacterium]